SSTIVSPNCAALIAACKLSCGPTVIVRRPPSKRSPNVPVRRSAKTTASVPTTTSTVANNKSLDTDLLIPALRRKAIVSHEHKLVASQTNVTALQLRQG